MCSGREQKVHPLFAQTVPLSFVFPAGCMQLPVDEKQQKRARSALCVAYCVTEPKPTCDPAGKCSHLPASLSRQQNLLDFIDARTECVIYHAHFEFDLEDGIRTKLYEHPK